MRFSVPCFIPVGFFSIQRVLSTSLNALQNQYEPHESLEILGIRRKNCVLYKIKNKKEIALEENCKSTLAAKI